MGSSNSSNNGRKVKEHEAKISIGVTSSQFTGKKQLSDLTAAHQRSLIEPDCNSVFLCSLLPPDWASVSDLVKNLSEVGLIPSQQLRVQIFPGQNLPGLQIWPIKDRSKDIYATVTGLRSFLAPVITSSALALAASGIPMHVVELIVSQTCCVGVASAPISCLIDKSNCRRTSSADGVIEHLELGLSYNTDDGLPPGPRQSVRATVKKMEYGATTEAFDGMLQVPSCIRMCHLLQHILETANLRQNTDAYGYFCATKLQSTTKLLAFNHMHSTTRLLEESSFRPGDIPAIHLDLTRYEEPTCKSGRPFMANQVPTVASPVGDIGAADWSCLSVAEILK